MTTKALAQENVNTKKAQLGQYMRAFLNDPTDSKVKAGLAKQLRAYEVAVVNANRITEIEDRRVSQQQVKNVNEVFAGVAA